ncbi:uncharacterized protein LOC131954824 [Physella acuta]|uniref:uncharacterized protein LOC131954824 n=1 Tax=Physella acuta TaxID=109671 RepID=UPI0027DE4941|nr:uncharacterized protein LOC131954824 [Physella acuta]
MEVTSMLGLASLKRRYSNQNDCCVQNGAIKMQRLSTTVEESMDIGPSKTDDQIFSSHCQNVNGTFLSWGHYEQTKKNHTTESEISKPENDTSFLDESTTWADTVSHMNATSAVSVSHETGKDKKLSGSIMSAGVNHWQSGDDVCLIQLKDKQSCPDCAAGKSGHIRHIGRWKLIDSIQSF